MKPLTVHEANKETLEELGRASVQVVHDLKNQLNGLKLYATFLRRRFQGRETATDELETIEKLMAGLERASGDATALVRYGRPLELKPQPTRLRKVLQTMTGDGELTFAPEADEATGNFDVPLLSEALRHITERARAASADGRATIFVMRTDAGGVSRVRVVWRGIAANQAENPFTSFAGGGGLRLALARRVVEAHGGVVSHTADSLVAELPAD